MALTGSPALDRYEVAITLAARRVLTRRALSRIQGYVRVEALARHARAIPPQTPEPVATALLIARLSAGAATLRRRALSGDPLVDLNRLAALEAAVAAETRHLATLLSAGVLSL